MPMESKIFLNSFVQFSINPAHLQIAALRREPSSSVPQTAKALLNSTAFLFAGLNPEAPRCFGVF
jgi:hypothetical protein